MLEALAEAKRLLGQRLSEWCPGAPSLESAVAMAALAQEELGHARALQPILEELAPPGSPVPSLPCLERPLPSWSHVVAVLALVDPALTVAAEALAAGSHDALRTRAARIAGEEAVHRAFAAGRVRELAASPDGRAALQARVDELLPQAVRWLGGDASGYLDAIDPILGAGGIDVAADEASACPWCGAREVERVGDWGPNLLVEQYLCLSCRSPFECIRRR